MQARNSVFPVALALLLGACASTPDSYDREARVAAATSAFGKPFSYFYIPSDGALEDAAFLAMSKTTGPSGMARELSGLMKASAQGPIRLLVTGPSREKTERVILDALSLQAEQGLQNLQFLFLGNASYEDTLRSAVESRGGSFSFAEY